MKNGILCVAAIATCLMPGVTYAGTVTAYDGSFSVRAPDDWKRTPIESFQHPGTASRPLVLEIKPAAVKNVDLEGPWLRIHRDVSEHRPDLKTWAYEQRKELSRISPNNKPSEVVAIELNKRIAWTFDSGMESTRFALIFFALGDAHYKASCPVAGRAECLNILKTASVASLK
jgi:hypothetical protein